MDGPQRSVDAELVADRAAQVAVGTAQGVADSITAFPVERNDCRGRLVHVLAHVTAPQVARLGHPMARHYSRVDVPLNLEV